MTLASDLLSIVSRVRAIPGQLGLRPYTVTVSVRSLSGAYGLEGDAGTTILELPVRLSIASSQTVTASWTTVRPPNLPRYPADVGSDYTAASGTVTFAPGDTEEVVSIPVVGDTVRDAPLEYLVVSFTGPTNAKMGGYWGLGLGSIVDDDGP